MDVPDKARHVLRFHKAVFDKLRAADDALQRSLELMRNVRRELAAHTLGLLLLGHVKGEDDRADAPASRLDTCEVEAVIPARALGTYLRVAVAHGRLHRAAHGAAAVYRQKVLPRAAVVRAENFLRRGVYAQDIAALVKQHEPFAHAAGDLRELVRPPPQLLELPVYLRMLPVYPSKQRRKLLISVVIQRMLKVKLIERIDYTRRHALCEQQRDYYRRGQHNEHRLQHAQREHDRRMAACRNAQHRAVRQALGVICSLFQQRRGIACALPCAGPERAVDLLAPEVVLH